MNGETRTFSWETWPSNGDVRGRFFNAVPNANIAIVNTKSKFRPVYIYEPGALIIPYGGGASELARGSPNFQSGITGRWRRYPRTAGTHLRSTAFPVQQFSLPNPPKARRARDGAMEAAFLMGLTDQPIAAALPVAHAWSSLKLKLLGGNFQRRLYRNDRAYHLHRSSNDGCRTDLQSSGQR